MKKGVKFLKKNRDNRGTSMATVLVSFALLLLFVTSYFQVQKVVSNMMMSAKDILNNNSALIKAYYLGETQDVTAADSVRLNFTGESGGFYIDATLNRASKEGMDGSIYYFAAEQKEQEE